MAKYKFIFRHMLKYNRVMAAYNAFFLSFKSI
jgi:hypothetical protein